MESRASVAGHPIHPMLVVFPVGLFLFSFICDLIFLATGNIAWSDVAYYAMAGGIVGGVAAAVPGAVDLFSMPYSRMRNIGLVHMTINLIVLALFAIDFWIRANAEPAAVGRCGYRASAWHCWRSRVGSAARWYTCTARA